MGGCKRCEFSSSLSSLPGQLRPWNDSGCLLGIEKTTHHLGKLTGVESILLVESSATLECLEFSGCVFTRVSAPQRLSAGLK